MAGSSEPEFRAMVKRYGWSWHKYGDVRYCIHCHKPLPKTEMMPDFMVCPTPIFVEVKNGDRTGAWNWAADIGPDGARTNQRKFLRENNGWLFIELGAGRHPKGYAAFLIPMEDWLIVEISLSQSSLPKDDTKRLIGGTSILKQWQLEWENGKWAIPKGHKWWYHLRSLTQTTLRLIEEKL